MEYSRTRHNIGYMVIDKLSRNWGIETGKKKFHSEIGDGWKSDEKIVLLKPQTYMNLSGKAVAAALSFFKLDPENLILVHDDIDLDFGVMKIRSSGGDGGHKGVRSVITDLGSGNFIRIRMGIDKPQYGEDPADFVLRTFYPEQAALLEDWVETGVAAVETILKDGFVKAGNLYNKKLSALIEN